MCHYEESLVQNTTTKIFQAHGKAELIEVWVMTSMEQKVNCFSKTCFPHLLSEKCSALSLSETDTIFNTFSGFKSIIPVLIKQDLVKLRLFLSHSPERRMITDRAVKSETVRS